MDIRQKSLEKHYEWNGKIEVISRVPISNAEDLSLAYTPGVAEPCLEIQKDYDKSFELTRRNNLVAVVTDGTAVLGLGDIGPEAGMPVMEGKCALFKEFGDVDAFPICVRSKDVDEIVEKKLKEKCDIPIFHDDQHGTAVIVAAGLINSLKLVGKKFEDIKVVMNGAGAAGIAIAKHLLNMGVKNITLCDSKGIICKGDERLNVVKREMAEITNLEHMTGTLADAMKGADVFLGISAAGCVSEEMVASMAKDPILFAMANPTPEIMPDLAKKAGAAVVGTGRSDFPNQINNVLAFPGIFRGAFDVRASDINEEMKIAAANALAGLISDEELNENYIIPAAFDPRVGSAVAKAVADAARASGGCRQDLCANLFAGSG